MKALVYEGPQKLVYRDMPEPVRGDDDVLVSIDSAGICGSDMHAFLGHDERRPAPLVLGHEVAGTIVEGDDAGRPVTLNPLVSCGRCEACRSGRDNLCPDRQIISMPPREGGFAELVAIPARNVVEVPSHVTPDQAALAEPIACGWHAVRLGLSSLGMMPQSVSALVVGGGAIGVGVALSLRAHGVEQVTMVEPNDLRRAYIAETCGEVAVGPAAGEANLQFDLVVDCVGIEATRAHSSACARPGGTIVHIGLGTAAGGLDVRRITLQEITFIGTYTYTAQDFRDTAQAMFEGRLGKLDWVETRPLDDGAQAFDDIRNGRVAAPKIILKPQIV